MRLRALSEARERIHWELDARKEIPMSRCPTCERATDGEQATRPFCSERCKMVDLSRWMDGSYRIPVGRDFTERTEPLSGELSAALARQGISDDVVH